MGAFTAESERCSTGRFETYCGWDGLFVSDDALVVVEGAYFDSEMPTKPGETFRLLYPRGGNFSVYLPGDRLPLTACAAFGLGGTGWLVVLGVQQVRDRRWRDRLADDVEPAPTDS